MASLLGFIKSALGRQSPEQASRNIHDTVLGSTLKLRGLYLDIINAVDMNSPSKGIGLLNPFEINKPSKIRIQSDINKIEDVVVIIENADFDQLTHNDLGLLITHLTLLQSSMSDKVITQLMEIREKLNEEDDFLTTLIQSCKTLHVRLSKVMVALETAERIGLLVHPQLARVVKSPQLAAIKAYSNQIPPSRVKQGIEDLLTEVNRIQIFTDVNEAEAHVIGCEFLNQVRASRTFIEHTRQVMEGAAWENLLSLPLTQSPLYAEIGAIGGVRQDFARSMDLTVNGKKYSSIYSTSEEECALAMAEMLSDWDAAAQGTELLPEQWYYIIGMMHQSTYSAVTHEFFTTLQTHLVKDWGETGEMLTKICLAQGRPVDFSDVYAPEEIQHWSGKKNIGITIEPHAVAVQPSPIWFRLSSAPAGSTLMNQSEPVGLRLDPYVIELAPVHRVWIEGGVARYELKRIARLVPFAEVKKAEAKSCKRKEITKLVGITQAFHQGRDVPEIPQALSDSGKVLLALKKARQAVAMLEDDKQGRAVQLFKMIDTAESQLSQQATPEEVHSCSRLAYYATKQSMAILIEILGNPAPAHIPEMARFEHLDQREAKQDS